MFKNSTALRAEGAWLQKQMHPLLLIDFQGRVVKANLKAAEFLGVGVVQLKGRGLGDVAGLTLKAADLSKLAENGKRVNRTVWVTTGKSEEADRRKVRILIYKSPVLGKSTSLVCRFIEMPPSRGVIKRGGRQELAETGDPMIRDHGEFLFKHAMDMMCVADVDGYFKRVNPAFEKVLGYTSAELCSKPFFNFVHPDDRAQTAWVLEGLSRGQSTVQFENRYLASDGTYRWLSWNAPASAPDSSLVYAVARDVTQFREIQIKLKKSEKYFREMADALLVMIWKTDECAKAVYLNRPWMEFTGVALESLLGDGWVEVIHPEDRERVESFWLEHFQRRHRFEIEYRIRRHDGDYGDICDQGAPRYDADGSFCGFIGTCIDVTEKRRNQEEIQKLAMVAKRTVNAVLLTDPTGLVEWVNDGFTRITGYESDEIIGKKPGDYLQGPETDPLTVQKLRAHIRAKLPIQAEILNYGKNGRKYWLNIEIQPIFNESGELVHYMAIEQEVTERREMEEKLRQSEQHFQKLSLVARHTVNAVLLTDSEGLIEWVNEGFTKITGYTLEEAFGKKPGVLLQGPETEAAAIMAMREAIRKKESVRVEILNYGKTGPPYWMDIQIQPIFDESGELTNFMAIQQEITERKQLQEKLRNEEERVQQILEASQVGVWDWNLGTNEIHWSEEAFKIFVQDPKTFVPDFNLYQELIVEEDRDRVLSEINLALKERTMYYSEHRIRLQDKSIRWICARGMFCNSHDNTIKMSGTVSDITDRKEIERKMIQEENLSSIGSLAGSVAHDFNNFMTGLNMVLSMMELEQDPAGLRQLMKMAKSAVEEASRLPRQLLSFAKGGNPVVIEMNPCLLREQADMCLVGSNILMEWEAEAGLYNILADPGQMSQVMSNLVINARQSMPMGGIITIRCRNEQRAVGEEGLGLPAGEYVRISIEDQGSGIPAAELPRIFEPFYTTKKDGNGLGLATCRRVLLAHRGQILCESRKGRGTIFDLWIPAIQNKGGNAVMAEDILSLKQFEGLVVIMDDDAIIATTIAKALEIMGVSAVTVSDGDECLAAYRTCLKQGQTVDFFLLDITIRGGMGAVETIRQLKELDPEILAVAHSGYSESDAMNRFGQHGFVSALRKPTNLKNIVHLCEQFLAPSVVSDGFFSK